MGEGGRSIFPASLLWGGSTSPITSGRLSFANTQKSHLQESCTLPATLALLGHWLWGLVGSGHKPPSGPGHPRQFGNHLGHLSGPSAHFCILGWVGHSFPQVTPGDSVLLVTSILCSSSFTISSTSQLLPSSQIYLFLQIEVYIQ